MVDKDRAEINTLKTSTSSVYCVHSFTTEMYTDSLSAFVSAFGAGFPVRLCQFQVMQAIRRWDKGRAAAAKVARRETIKREGKMPKESGTPAKQRKSHPIKSKNKGCQQKRKSGTGINEVSDKVLEPSLPKEAMSGLLELFRKVQRWRAEVVDWNTMRGLKSGLRGGVPSMCWCRKCQTSSSNTSKKKLVHLVLER